MNQPLVSIIIPTYNRAHRIKRALESVVSQKFSNWEIIVVDDGSVDNTREVIESIGVDTRIKYYYKENQERSIARNFGIAKSNGRYINFLDSDDIQLPNHLSTFANTLKESADADVIHLGFQTVDSTGQTLVVREDLPDIDVQKVMFRENILHGNAIFIKREILNSYGFLDSPEAFLSEDWYLWVKLLPRFRFVYDRTVTSSVIEHEERSLNTIDPIKLIGCTELIISSLKEDEVFNKLPGRGIFYGAQLTFLTLTLSQHKEHWKKTIKYLLLGIIEYPLVVIERRFLASIKHLLIGLFSKNQH